MRNEGKRTEDGVQRGAEMEGGRERGRGGVGEWGKASGRRPAALSFLRDRNLKLRSGAHGLRHGAEIAACVLVFTSQLTWEGKSLTSVSAARVHPSSWAEVFFTGGEPFFLRKMLI